MIIKRISPQARFQSIERDDFPGEGILKDEEAVR